MASHFCLPSKRKGSDSLTTLFMSRPHSYHRRDRRIAKSSKWKRPGRQKIRGGGACHGGAIGAVRIENCGINKLKTSKKWKKMRKLANCFASVPVGNESLLDTVGWTVDELMEFIKEKPHE